MESSNSEVGWRGGVSPPRSHRTGRESLPSSGSYRPAVTYGLVSPKGSSHLWLASRAKLDDSAPSLQSHYKTFITTTSWSAPVPRIGTLASRGLPAWASPLTSRRQVPTFHTGAANQVHAISMPDAAWAVSRFPPDSSRDSDGTPGFDVVWCFVSTPHQWFAYARLLDSHLTESSVRLFPWRSPPRLFTAAAQGGLEPAPAGRLRGAYPHLLYSLVAHHRSKPRKPLAQANPSTWSHRSLYEPAL